MTTNYFIKIDESNKLTLNKPLNSDIIYYSELNNWNTNNAFRSFSVKFVIDQCIQYKTDGIVLSVEAEHYMVACQNSDVKAYFENKQKVRSVCIDICQQTMAETFTVLTTKNHDLDNFLSGYFKYPEFYENISSIHHTTIGRKLKILQELILKDQTHLLTKEWFMDLAERIIYQEYGNYLSLNELKSVRLVTRKEILRRLKQAKDYIEENYLTIQETKQIAIHCNMSEYHFYRCFKQVYKKTPHQCIIEKKMLLAKKLLQKNQFKVSEIASICNFPDIYSFSKAFKNFFGINPSSIK